MDSQRAAYGQSLPAPREPDQVYLPLTLDNGRRNTTAVASPETTTAITIEPPHCVSA